MNLISLLDKKNIILNLKIESKKRLIEFLSNRLADSYPDVNQDQVLQGLYSRERIGNTYIGKNIYIPHCRVYGLQTTKIIISTLKDSYYDYSIEDDIKIAIGVFFPEKVSEIHTELLKELASFLKKGDTQSIIENAIDTQKLYKYIISESQK